MHRERRCFAVETCSTTLVELGRLAENPPRMLQPPSLCARREGKSDWWPNLSSSRWDTGAFLRYGKDRSVGPAFAVTPLAGCLLSKFFLEDFSHWLLQRVSRPQKAASSGRPSLDSS